MMYWWVGPRNRPLKMYTALLKRPLWIETLRVELLETSESFQRVSRDVSCEQGHEWGHYIWAGSLVIWIIFKDNINYNRHKDVVEDIVKPEPLWQAFCMVQIRMDENWKLMQHTRIKTTQLTSNASFVLNGSQWDFKDSHKQIGTLNLNMLNENQSLFTQIGYLCKETTSTLLTIILFIISISSCLIKLLIQN